MRQACRFVVCVGAVAVAGAMAVPARATDSEAVWLPQSRQVHVSPESLGYPAEPASPPGARVAPRTDPEDGRTSRPTDRRTDSNWRLRPVLEKRPSDRSTIPGEDALNRPTALQLRL